MSWFLKEQLLRTRACHVLYTVAEKAHRTANKEIKRNAAMHIKKSHSMVAIKISFIVGNYIKSVITILIHCSFTP